MTNPSPLSRVLVNSFVFALAVLSLSFAPLKSEAAVWETKQTWNPGWEARYHQWVEANWTKDYFAKPGPFQNVIMDCADAVYSMRLVFAYENGLPFVINDGTGGSNFISNEMSRWDNLSPDRRARQFLLYIFQVGATATLPRDSYPVAANRDGIGSGRFILTDAKSHHSWTVKRVSETGIPYLLFASRPARTIFFDRFEFPSMGFTFQGSLKPERHAGFRAFRLPEDLKKPVWQVPGYSLEQYEIPYDKWIRTMQRRLQLTQETPEARIKRVLNSACIAAKERVDAVNEALAGLSKIGSRCFNATEYDNFSTPSRDTRLKDTFLDLVEAYEVALSTGAPLEPGLATTMKALVAGATDAAGLAFCPITIAPGRVLSLGQIYHFSKDGKLSNNPHDPLEMRWGLARFPSAKAKACPVY